MGTLGDTNSQFISALSQPHHRPISSKWPRLPRPGLVGLGVLGCRLLAGKHRRACTHTHTHTPQTDGANKNYSTRCLLDYS